MKITNKQLRALIYETMANDLDSSANITKNPKWDETLTKALSQIQVIQGGMGIIKGAETIGILKHQLPEMLDETKKLYQLFVKLNKFI